MGETTPLSINPPEALENSLFAAQTLVLRFCSAAVMRSAGRRGGIKGEKGETVTFSTILTIFYRFFSVPHGERPQGLGFIR